MYDQYTEWVRQHEALMAMYAEAMARILDEDIRGGVYTPTNHVPNTFRLRPEPREGFIDARRSDGCVQVITEIV